MPDFSDPGLPGIDSAEDIARGKFLALRRLLWRDAGGVERVWESAERSVFFGAVLIFAWLKPSDRLVVIRQYRPPAGRFVYELPAGLMDKDETPGEAALRELREETGYIASSVEVAGSGGCYTSPGLSSEAVFMAAAEIDENAPENAAAARRTEFDAAEDIETLLIPRAGLALFYRDESLRGRAFDSKLAAYILGMK